MRLQVRGLSKWSAGVLLLVTMVTSHHPPK